MGFFTAGESEQSIYFADAGMKAQVAQFLEAGWPRYSPEWKAWLAGLPQEWQRLQAVWPQLPEGSRQGCRNVLLPIFKSYADSYRQATSAAGPAGDYAFHAGMRIMEAETARQFEIQRRDILGLPPW